MPKVLIVEDSNFFSSVLMRGIEGTLGFEAVCVESYGAAQELLAKSAGDFFMAFLDLNLGDAPDGEVVDMVVETGLPAVVFTGDADQSRRDEFFHKGVVDYVLKDTPASIGYLIGLARRIYRNRNTKAMVVDDSRTARRHVGGLLARYQFDTFEAAHGPEALAIIGEHPEMRLVVVDHEMPGMDGFELIRRIRSQFPPEKMVVIGISGGGGGLLSAKLIKYGANDFISKPFIEEEFLTRINQNLDMLDSFEQVREAADMDFLTGLYNRRFLYQSGSKLVANAQRSGANIVTAVIDIDHFKDINDSHGHDVGDQVLKQMGAFLKDRFREGDVVARTGGEEFCVLAVDMQEEAAFRTFEAIRTAAADLKVVANGSTVSPTISIGVAKKPCDSLETMISRADGLLYEAKQAGRDRVVAE